jgi:CBS domain-containing protein
MSVQQLLSDKGYFVSIVPANALIKEVMEQLKVDEVSAIIVSDNGKDISGIISEKNILRGLKQHGEAVMQKQARELMQQDVITCDIDESIHRVYELMDKHQISYVPITKLGRLCGIISLLNVIKHRLNEMDKETTFLRDYITGRAA